jgi:hypothetical protein
MTSSMKWVVSQTPFSIPPPGSCGWGGGDKKNCKPPFNLIPKIIPQTLKTSEEPDYLDRENASNSDPKKRLSINLNGRMGNRGSSTPLQYMMKTTQFISFIVDCYFPRIEEREQFFLFHAEVEFLTISNQRFSYRKAQEHK